MDSNTTKNIKYGYYLIIILIHSSTAIEGIIGRREPCSNEGEIVPVSIIDTACFKCICQNGFVECEQEQCPSVDDCYMLENTKNGCCEKCKDCVFNGKIYSSGSEWVEPEAPCNNFKCVAGVITETNIQCHTQCSDPQPPRVGQCCPTCLGCRFNGQIVQEGREVTLSEDPCLKCYCSSKRLTCMKRACPVLQCPKSKQIKPEIGECCPRCKEKRPVQDFRGKCIFGTGFHANGDRFKPDHCSNCQCNNGTSICHRDTCPVLECPLHFQKLTPGECCPHCPLIAEVKSTCTYEGITYQNNQTWNLDVCRSCQCHSGTISCVQESCKPVKCRSDEELITQNDQCCPKCVENAGVCTVYGDPHYKTFDGKFFHFQGSCKYLLTSDCVSNTFSIRVTNDARKSKSSSSWTKTVTLKLGSIKVNLGQKQRVKIDGKRIRIPFQYDDDGGDGGDGDHRVGGGHHRHHHLLNITKSDDLINVTTSIGIQLLWDGINFLQVQASSMYKGKLCGLCGNYNKVIRDDLQSRRGENYTDDKVWLFANSWKVGGTKACARKDDHFRRVPICRSRNKYWTICKHLNESNFFGDCDSRLNPSNYIESCKRDMCECPSGKCYCESFAAYAHECKRLGAQVLPVWKKAIRCDTPTQKIIFRRHRKRNNNNNNNKHDNNNNNNHNNNNHNNKRKSSIFDSSTSKMQEQIMMIHNHNNNMPKNGKTKVNKLSELPIY